MKLAMGGNAILGTAADGGLSSIVLGVTWDAGPLECDVCALVCGAERKVLGDDYFVYWGNLASPDHSVFLRAQAEPHDPSLDRAQVLVDLTDLPTLATNIVVTLSTLTAGANLSVLRNVNVRALNPTTGAEIASYSMGHELSAETCLILVELYKNKGNWKLRAIGQGYHSGLAGLGNDFGVNIA